MRCMSCLETYPRRQVCLCQGCKAWYCSECQADHCPCNQNLPDEVTPDEASDDIDDEDEVDDLKPGIWIVKQPEATRIPFNIWSYVQNASELTEMADLNDLKMMM